MTETYLPRATNAGARLAVGRRVDRLVVDRRAGDAVARSAIVTDRAGATTDPFGPRRRVRRGDPDAGAAATLGTRPAARSRRSPSTRPSSWPPASPTRSTSRRRARPPGQGVRTRPVVRRLGVEPGLVALALSDHWALFGDGRRGLAQHRRVLRGDHQRGPRPRGRVPGWRDPLVTYRLTRRDRALLGRGLARLALCAARSRCHRGLPVVPRRPDRAHAGRPGHVAGHVRHLARASVMTVHLCSTVPMGGDAARRRRQLRTRPRHRQRLRQRRLAAPDAPGVNPQASVMAVAIRNARRFVDAHAGGPMMIAGVLDPPATPSSPAPPGGSGGRCSTASPTTRTAARRRRCGRSSRRRRRRRRARRHAGVEPVVGDVRRLAGLGPLFAGCRGDRRRDPRRRRDPPGATSDWVEVNARGTPNVAAALAAGVRRVVHVSSNSPFGTNPTAATCSATTSRTHPYLGYGARRCWPSCACSTRSPPGSTP